MLSEERQLLRWWRRLKLDGPAIADAVESAQPGDLFEGRVGQGRWQVLAIEVSALVSRNQLRPVLRED